MALEEELATYELHRAGWLASGKKGQWVVIHKQDIVGFFPTLEDGATVGYERFGLNELFMVRQISEEQRPVQASRRAVHANRQPGD